MKNNFSTTLNEEMIRFDIAIIGGGASGILLLLHLIRITSRPVKIVLFNKGYPLVEGVAYSTFDKSHLLNVRAGRMSAYADDPSHFVNWLWTSKEYTDKKENENLNDAFIPRHLYGQYLNETYQQVVSNLPPGFTLKIIDDKVVEIAKKNNYHIRTENGLSFESDKTVLCTGIEPPYGLPGIKITPNDSRIIINPWNNKVHLPSEHNNVLVIGTGLTMVDTVLSLLNAGFRGKIVALSKHGQLPMAHPEHKQTAKPSEHFSAPEDLSSLYSIIKQRIKEHPDPQGWEEPILEDIRPYTQQLWFNYTKEEKLRFLRHLQHLWSKLRHRIPFQIFLQLNEAIEEKKLELAGGKLIHLNCTETDIIVTYFDRKSGEEKKVNVSHIYNCTGPVLDVEKSINPAIQSLYTNGLIRNSDAKLGPDALPDGRLIDQSGNAHQDLFLLGPPMRGSIWEAVAVPEIRTGAKSIASMLLNSQFLKTANVIQPKNIIHF
jgi:uncharacterized NAD(P)/FAD-binding protein YdhS